MSFVGKILVVVQLVFSIVFMAFAGAVYTARVNWREEATKQKAQVATITTEKQTLQTEFDKFKDGSAKDIKAATDRADSAEAANRGLKQQGDQLAKEKKDLTVALATANELAQIAGDEARARRDEALIQREINTKLLASRDVQFKQKTSLQDELQGLKLNFDVAQFKNKDLLNQVALYRKILEANNISTDPKELAARINVPPKVEGKILATKPPRAQGGSELIEISLGSDDGLTKGHEVYIYRSGLENGAKSKYLGKARIVQTDPDRSVGEVLEKVRNGIIEEGDNVTTKL